MSEKKEKKFRVIDLIIVIILIIVLVYFYNIYKETTFNDFILTEYIPNVSEFTRDKNVKYSDIYSYKIESKNYNDAAFYKTIEVEKNTVYRISCMVKTQNVVTEKDISESGAQISILDTIEKSKSIIGTTEWTKIELLFDSKNREKVDVGFRLGGFEDNAKGTAWFSDFKIETGIKDTSNEWNFACFIIKNTDIQNNNDGYNAKLSMSSSDIYEMENNIVRFKNTAEEFSEYKMKVNYDIIQIEEPVTSLSYDEESGYYVAPKDVMKIIDSYLDENEYDHIFICVRLGDGITQTKYEWLGIGGISYRGMGFSNIRLPNDENSYLYRYNVSINTFPEEVFVHEFLHTLEHNQMSYGYEIPALHDYEKYGYKNEAKIGQLKWYRDYMQKNIDSINGKIGIESFIYTSKPVHESDFKYAYNITKKVYSEPQNIIDDFKFIIKRIRNSFSEKASLNNITN